MGPLESQAVLRVRRRVDEERQSVVVVRHRDDLDVVVTSTVGDLIEHQVVEVVMRRTETTTAQTMILIRAAVSVSAVVMVVLPVYRSGKILVR